MKLFPIEILQVTVNKIEVLSSFYVGFCRLAVSAENGLKEYLGFLLMCG